MIICLSPPGRVSRKHYQVVQQSEIRKKRYFVDLLCLSTSQRPSHRVANGTEEGLFRILLRRCRPARPIRDAKQTKIHKYPQLLNEWLNQNQIRRATMYTLSSRSRLRRLHRLIRPNRPHLCLHHYLNCRYHHRQYFRLCQHRARCFDRLRPANHHPQCDPAH